MAEISVYDPRMFVWIDETDCDCRHSTRKYGCSVRSIPICDQRILIRGTIYTAIPVISTDGIHDVFIAEGTMNGDHFTKFVRSVLLPHLNPFNGVNPRSVVIMDNATIIMWIRLLILLKDRLEPNCVFSHHIPLI